MGNVQWNLELMTIFEENVTYFTQKGTILVRKLS